MGSGCGAVGGVITFQKKGQRFESINQPFSLNIRSLQVCRKDQENEAGNGPVNKSRTVKLYIKFDRIKCLPYKLLSIAYKYPVRRLIYCQNRVGLNIPLLESL